MRAGTPPTHPLVTRGKRGPKGGGGWWEWMKKTLDRSTACYTKPNNPPGSKAGTGAEAEAGGPNTTDYVLYRYSPPTPEPRLT